MYKASDWAFDYVVSAWFKENEYTCMGVYKNVFPALY